MQSSATPTSKWIYFQSLHDIFSAGGFPTASTSQSADALAVGWIDLLKLS